MIKCKECNNGEIEKLSTDIRIMRYNEELKSWCLNKIEPYDSCFRCDSCFAEYNETEINNIIANKKDWEY